MDLQTIFGYLVKDPHFLVTVYDEVIEEEKEDKFGNTVNILMDYTPLMPFDVQKYYLFSSDFKKILPTNYMRCGIKNAILRNITNINISFLNSLNILLRPSIFRMDLEDQIKNYELFESFVMHKIKGNCRIDKVKNTKKIQAINKDLAQQLAVGKINFDIIQAVINIFEVNLLIFNMTSDEVSFYWSSGHEFPSINLFNDLLCMSLTQHIFEPIMSLEEPSEEMIRNMYVNILQNNSIHSPIPINLNIKDLMVLDHWNIDSKAFANIAQRYCQFD